MEVTTKAWKILHDNGYDDSLAWVIEQLDYSIPEGSPKIDLAGVGAAWLALRMQ